MNKVKKRMHKTEVSPKSAMGVAWYRREQWDRLLEISSDRQELEDTFEQWKVMAEEDLRKLSQHGYMIRKVDIDVEELLKWCKSNQRPVDGNSRTEFTVIKLQKLDKDNS